MVYYAVCTILKKILNKMQIFSLLNVAKLHMKRRVKPHRSVAFASTERKYGDINQFNENIWQNCASKKLPLSIIGWHGGWEYESKI